ncbi:NfeD family protein [Corynebacterium choanae]|uniref:NfeD-like C-terminal domain-containing protein n=1 Tax=Corynebacterium choanae TaxID=1862358 RepID=A0A3G6J672_9CORY|nr:NfeD family protein [Corynebacterium choanae]AZA13595.1 hypothetical protein CCHOA_05980 [Corynebacterium choanae]
MGALIWLVAGLLLVLAELFIGDFTLLMLGGGALTAAAVGGIFSPPVWVLGVVFSIVALLLVTTVRPIMRRQLTSKKQLDHSPQALVGSYATVIEAVDHLSGQIRLDGSIWSARSMDPQHHIAPGKQVQVLAIDGACAVVFDPDASPQLPGSPALHNG